VQVSVTIIWEHSGHRREGMDHEKGELEGTIAKLTANTGVSDL